MLSPPEVSARKSAQEDPRRLERSRGPNTASSTRTTNLQTNPLTLSMLITTHLGCRRNAPALALPIRDPHKVVVPQMCAPEHRFRPEGDRPRL
eukprot:1184615-Prorocentrum_minimum.AAC.5